MIGALLFAILKRPRRNFGAVFIGLLALTLNAWAGPDSLPEAFQGHANVLADGTLVAVEGHAGAVRLAAIQVPDPTPQRKDDPSPFETKAYAALNGLLENHAVSVRTLPISRPP